ncbi:hypothetical protein ABPG77_000774 [Micractinium sp. CCAP 211/92]
MSSLLPCRPALAPARSSFTACVHLRRPAPASLTGYPARWQTLPSSVRCSAYNRDNTDSGKDAEALAAGAESLDDRDAEVGKKARKLRRRGEEAAGAAEDAAAAAVDLAATAASEAADAAATTAEDIASDAADVAKAAVEEGAQAVASVQEDAASAASQLAEGVASGVADVAGAVQAAAEDVQQQAADAARSSGTGKPAGRTAATQPSAGSPGAPAPTAGELPSAPQPLAALPENAGADPGSVPSGTAPGGAAHDNKQDIPRLKESLVGMLASLDRGAAASADQAERVEALVKRLEALGGPVSLSWERPAGDSKPGMALLDGRWRLLYSSGFTSGSLGGRRPGPAFGSSLVTLGQVFQDIYTDKEELDNVVDLFLRTSAASLPLPGLDIAVPTATARLRHTFRVINGKTVEITFTDTEVKLAGGLGGWLDSVPRFTVPSLVPDWLQSSSKLRSACFDVVYLDEDMRITRGDRGEVRVFAKGMV